MEIVGGFSPAQVEARHYCLLQKRRSLYSGYILMLLQQAWGEGAIGAVKLGRPGTPDLTSGQCLSFSVAFLLPLPLALKNAKFRR